MLYINFYNKNIFDFEKDILHDFLKKRGITDIKSFLNPDLSVIVHSLELPNVVEVCETIIKHSEDKVYIQVDQDADGFMCATILYSYFKRAFPNMEIFVGMPEEKSHALDLRNKANFGDLVIIPDAGSNNGELYQDLKCDLVVIDHHKVKEPEKIDFLLVTNQLGYSNPNLSGSGVVYKVCQVLDEMLGVGYAADYLDMAVVGIKADMMDVRHPEIQYLFNMGFHIKNKWLKEIVKKEVVEPYDIAFTIAPKINAVTRMGTIEEKMALFYGLVDGASSDEIEASVKVCTKCKTTQDNARDEFLDQLEDEINTQAESENKFIFIKSNDI